jgi:hypothetical protein
MMKLSFEMIWNNDAGGHYLLIPMMFMLAIASAIYNLHLLNQAMKFYSQMEVVPVYQTALLIFWIATGLIILDEKKFYSGLELSYVFASVLLCLIGIKVLTMKKKLLEEEKATRQMHQTELS